MLTAADITAAQGRRRKHWLATLRQQCQQPALLGSKVEGRRSSSEDT